MEQIETGTFASPSYLPERPTAIRVVNWNIDRGSQLREVIEFLASTNADLILLQETEVNAWRTGFRNAARDISQKLRMNYAFGCEFHELTQASRTSPAYHGQTTLSRWPLSGFRVLRFRSQSSFWRPRWFVPNVRPLQRRIGGRMALSGRVEIAGKSLITYNVHLESRSDKVRGCQLLELLDDTRRYSPEMPVVAAGDFNFDISQGRARAAIRSFQFHNPFEDKREPTTPSRSFRRARTIDWILTRGLLTAISPQVHPLISASDHYPLSLTLRLS